MNQKASTTALKLLNLYRQEHVIVGGWAVINPVLVNEATDDVIKELREMPNGKTLILHIQNLRDGKTPMNTIARELLPYGGMMGDEMPSVTLDAGQWYELETAINNFTPDQSGLDAFQANDVVKKFGEEWPVAIRAILSEKPHLIEKWDKILQTYNAYRLWNMANEIIANPMSERARAKVQADMPEYETYLPMFGDAGNEMLARLRVFVSSMN
ncbi:MAG: hypothetical protein J6K82_03360 [Alphaproteobacteria bacterium]|nr:hypothetical protein [Alphaproteobacteria bacterium]